MKEISRLRRKFIIYNMFIVTAVIGITFAALAAVLRSRGNEEGRLILKQAVEQPGARLIFDAAPQVRLPYFSVLVTENGEVLMREGAYNSFPGAAYLEQLAFLGMAAEADDGILDAYQLRYLRVEQPAGHLLVFADTSYGDTVQEALLRYGGLACAAIWLFFLGLSFLFSHWVTRPVARSLRLQKQFVADASHELKTPLAVIFANAELLRERCAGLPEEAEKWLGYIHQECREMRALVDSLLLLAREDAWAGRREGWQTVSFSDLVTEQSLVFEPLFYQEGKTFGFEVEEAVWVKGDAAQLGQLVKVLLDNAVKYTAAGGRAEVRLETVGRLRARLWVNSEGEAIPKERRSLIFQRFYRDEKVRAARSGYGLGLAIASRIAANHRAKLGVEYRDGKNCFYAELHTVSRTKEKAGL